MDATRAMVVDNNRGLAETVADILSDRGFEVEVAVSGVQALAAWRKRPADVVVLDVDLPDIGGLTLARRLTRRGPGCALVVMSAGDAQRVALACDKLGAAFLAKPFDPCRLLAAVRRILREAAAGRAEPSSPPPTPGRRLLAARSPKALLQHSRPRRKST